MNLKISVERPSGQKLVRKAARNPRGTQYASGPRLQNSSYPKYADGPMPEPIRQQRVRRIPAPPKRRQESEAQRGLLSRAFAWLRGGTAPEKQLRVLETVPLGEKRTVAIIEAEGHRFLVGCGANGVALLRQLDESQGPEVEAEIPVEIEEDAE